MNLRHIDPRSSDWMDAMLEGERQIKATHDKEPEEPQDVAGLVAAAAMAPTSPPGIRSGTHAARSGASSLHPHPHR